MKTALAALAILVGFPCVVLGFGQNKLQYRDFDWTVLKSKYFDVYYYDEQEFLGNRVALIADASYESISRNFGHQLSRRVPIMVYLSQNEFQQTNITLELLSEGVGGFTELFKNRVVVPFTGSYEELRHVLMHELTHVFSFDMLYGGLLESVFTRQYAFSLPLWLLEGLTEYQSEFWSAEAEMVMRDAAINGYYFSLYEDRGGYIAYKQGQSVVRYIAERYGREKIKDIIQNISATRNVEKALEASLGVDSRGLTRAWTEHLKKRYWPDIATKTDPEDLATRLTDHRKTEAFANIMPAISPDGQEIVFLSDRSGYDDVYLMSALDGRIMRRLVKGQRTKDFESFHTLRSSFSWSPDGKRIAFVSKSKADDVINIVDADSGKRLRKIKPDFSSVYRPAFSPDGRQVAFIASEGGRAGIYAFDLENGNVEALHLGALEYLGFSWSPDGESIAFSAIAPGYVDSLFIFSRVDPRQVSDRDIFLLRVSDGLTRRLTYCPSEDVSPVWSPDGSRLLFVSDRNGSYNLYVYDLADSTTSQLSDVLGGIFSPTWSSEGDRLAFTCFNGGGWDIYQIKDPVGSLPPIKELPERDWRWGAPWLAEGGFAASDSIGTDFPHLASDTTMARTVREYTESPYQLRFTPDWVAGSFQYSTAFGLGGMTRVSVSDVLGNHQLFLATDFFADFDETDVLGIYYYLGRRTDYGAGLFHFKNYYYSDRTTMGAVVGEGKEEKLFSERNYGGVLALSYPLDMFRRLDFDFTAMRIQRDIFMQGYEYTEDPPIERREIENLFIPRLSYVKDTSIWGPTGPVGGTRYMLSVERSIVDVFGSDLSFTTGVLDYRKYFRLTPRTQFATRLLGATSQGANPMVFYLGGGYTLRGYDDFEFEGNNILLANLELRYPFIERLVMRGPIALSIGDLRGVFFFDIGGAWHGEFGDLRVAHVVDGREELDDLNASYGFGVRMWLAYFLMKLDFAWGTRFNGQVGRRVHFTLGGEF